MALTDASRCFLSTLQVATTWQSGSLMKFPVFPGPCMPQPTTPIVMRPEGAGRYDGRRGNGGCGCGDKTATGNFGICWFHEELSCPLDCACASEKMCRALGRRAMSLR